MITPAKIDLGQCTGVHYQVFQVYIHKIDIEKLAILKGYTIQICMKCHYASASRYQYHTNSVCQCVEGQAQMVPLVGGKGP